MSKAKIAKGIFKLLTQADKKKISNTIAKDRGTANKELLNKLGLTKKTGDAEYEMLIMSPKKDKLKSLDSDSVEEFYKENHELLDDKLKNWYRGRSAKKQYFETQSLRALVEHLMPKASNKEASEFWRKLRKHKYEGKKKPNLTTKELLEYLQSLKDEG